MVTFNEQETWPLSALSIIGEHYGIDMGGEDFVVCSCTRCGQRLATNEDAERHVGKCEDRQPPIHLIGE